MVQLDGHDMVAPSGEGGERAMRIALSTQPDSHKSATSMHMGPQPL